MFAKTVPMSNYRFYMRTYFRISIPSTGYRYIHYDVDKTFDISSSLCMRVLDHGFYLMKNCPYSVGKWSKYKRNHRWISLRYANCFQLQYSSFRWNARCQPGFPGNLIRVRNTVPLYIVERNNGFCKYR